jgi:hypothetical protein
MIHAPAVLAAIAVAPSAPDGGWRVARRMAADPAQVLVGRAPQEAATLAPLIFNLCGAAHARAAAAALGLDREEDAPALARAAARERARDHARAVLVEWPQALGEAPDRASLGLLARPDGAPALARALVGEARDLCAFSLTELDAWLAAGATQTVRLLARLRRETDPAFGRAGLPVLTPQTLGAMMAAPDAPPPPMRGRGGVGGEAAAQIPAAMTSGGPTPPTLPSPARGEGGRGAPPAQSSPPQTGEGERGGGLAPLHFETGALARLAETPLFRALLAQEGPTLFARLLARLADGLDALSGAAEPALSAPPGVGLAFAARGLLAHGARCDAGRVASYRVVSPCAWNLVPGGLMERALAALPAGAAGARLAPLLVSAINPCVPVSFPAAEAAHA